MFPIVATFRIENTEIPFSVQIARANSFLQLLRPKVFLFMIALSKFEKAGVLAKPGKYMLLVDNRRRARLFDESEIPQHFQWDEDLFDTILIIRPKKFPPSTGSTLRSAATVKPK